MHRAIGIVRKVIGLKAQPPHTIKDEEVVLIFYSIEYNEGRHIHLLLHHHRGTATGPAGIHHQAVNALRKGFGIEEVFGTALRKLAFMNSEHFGTQHVV